MKVPLIIALFFAACARADASEITIAAFGDSLSAGYGLAEKDGFAAALQRELVSAGVPARVLNAAVSGDTSGDGLLRVDWMLQETDPDIVIVEFGANDMFRGLPVSEVKKNLSTILSRISEYGARALLTGMRAPTNYDPSYRNSFDNVFELLSEQHEVPLYPFFLEGVALRPELNLDDGIHPNAEGVRIIAQNIAPLVSEIAEGMQ